MSIEPATLEVMEPEQKQLLAVVQETGIQPDTAASLQTSFAPLFRDAKTLVEQSKQIVVTDVSQTVQMKLAREFRLGLRKIRIESDKKRKDMGETARKTVNAINGFHNILLHIVDTEETRLDEQEKFAVRKEEERKAALKLAREEQLKPFGLDTSFMDLGAMPDSTFTQLLENSRAAAERKAEDTRKAEAARIEAENARLREEARIREENEKLKREAEEREKSAKAERERLEAVAADERKKAAEAKRLADEEAARLKAEADKALAEEKRVADEAAMVAQKKAAAALKAQKDKAAATQKIADLKAAEFKAQAERELAEARAARQKAEIEFADAKAEQERQHALKAQQEAEENARIAAAALAPDREKLTAYVAQVRRLVVPTMSTEAGQLIVTDLAARLEAFAAYVERKASQL